MRLTGRQAELLFSTLWLQANMADNWPSSYEAMAHTYSLALLFSRPRVSPLLFSASLSSLQETIILPVFSKLFLICIYNICVTQCCRVQVIVPRLEHCSWLYQSEPLL